MCQAVQPVYKKERDEAVRAGEVTDRVEVLARNVS